MCTPMHKKSHSIFKSSINQLETIDSMVNIIISKIPYIQWMVEYAGGRIKERMQVNL